MIGRSASKDIAKASANGDIQSFITIMSLEGEYAFIGLNGFGKEMCKFNNRVTFIKPFFFEEGTQNYNEWINAMKVAEKSYFQMLKNGANPQEARSVLPNSTKTEITITANYREWRAFFKLRTAKAAHPQIQEVTRPLLKELKSKLPIIFDDIEMEE